VLPSDFQFREVAALHHNFGKSFERGRRARADREDAASSTVRRTHRNLPVCSASQFPKGFIATEWMTSASFL
jgi:hypothetical protein